MENKTMLRSVRKYVVFFALGRFFLRKPFQKIVKYNSTLHDPGKETFLIVSNHTNVLDPAYLYTSLKTHYRVVTSDHAFENPVGGFLLKYFSAPIISYQNNSPDVVYNEMLESLKNGVNVSLYVEARITDTGETGYISKRNASLVKEAGCGLITYRFRDGYFNQPRWSRERRWGPVSGELMHQYSAAQIAHMTEEEIYETICQDLYYNAYEEQRLSPTPYHAKHPAEYAEYVLYGCPKCGSIGHLHSKDDAITCSDCGFRATVDDYGFWHSPDMTFDDIPRWDAYQKGLIYDLLDSAPDNETVLFSDDEQTILFIDRERKTHLADKHGEVAVYKDHFTVSFQGQTLTIHGEDVKKIKYISKGTLVVVTKDYNLRIKTKTPRAATKYVVAGRYMRGIRSL